MPAQHTDFNYLSLLRLLERSIVPRGESQALRGKAIADIIGKGVKVTRDLRHTLVAALGKLASSRRSDRQLKANLKLTCERLHKQEGILIRNIEECAQGLRPQQSFKLAGWPPMVPAESMVAHFAAHAIGLQSDNPECQLSENVRATWLEVVAPALAWGILAQLQDADPTPDDRKRIADRIRNGMHAELGLPGQTSDLPYLRFAEAWFEVLQGDNDWQLQSPDIQVLRDELAKLIVEANIRQLWATLGGHFSHVFGGSERAKAVQLASRRLPDQPKAAFLRDRLALLESSRHPAVQELAKESRRNPAKAVEIAKAWLAGVCPAEAKDKPLSPDQCVIACGMAYWLAHMLFKAHLREWTPQYGNASDQLAKLLTSAAKSAATPNEKALCLRFLAGYCSNPRYYRSKYIIGQARNHIVAYGNLPEAKDGLCKLFMARLHWQRYQSMSITQKGEADRQMANELFKEALRSTDRNQMDSEGPVHLFPEIMAALNEQLQNKKGVVDAKRNGGSLALLDYLSQRAYGVYFDAPSEIDAIAAGCRQFAEAHKRDPKSPTAQPSGPEEEQQMGSEVESEADRNEAAAQQDPRMVIAENQRAGLYQLWDRIELGIRPNKKK